MRFVYIHLSSATLDFRDDNYSCYEEKSVSKYGTRICYLFPKLTISNWMNLYTQLEKSFIRIILIVIKIQYTCNSITALHGPVLPPGSNKLDQTHL